jgi:hypothetical protein
LSHKHIQLYKHVSDYHILSGAGALQKQGN